jgi:Flp pilus assembly protein CpaB
MMDVPQARRISRPSWINLRTVLGLLLFCLAFLAGQRVLDDSRVTVAVWSATRDLGADSVIGDDDITAVDVKLPDDAIALYALASDDLVGTILTRPVRAREIVPVESVATAPEFSTGRSMTIPVTPEHANGGALRPGDRIDVFATFDPGDVRARTTILVRAVEVLDVVTAGGLVGDSESAVGITVAVTPEDAARLAFAIRTAEIDVARITGEAGGEGPKTVRAEDFE